MRKAITEVLKPIAQVSVLSNRKGTIKKPTLVLQRKPSMASISNSRCLFVYWDILCYVPEGSMVQLDELVSKVTNTLLENKFEITNTFSGDFYDEELKAYMRFVEIRTPETIL